MTTMTTTTLMTTTRRLLLAAIGLAPALAAVACGGAQPAPAVQGAGASTAGVSTVAALTSSPEPGSVSAHAESPPPSAPVPPSAAIAEAAPAPEPGTPTPAAAPDPSTVQELFDDTARAPAAALKSKTGAGDPAAALVQGLSELAKRAAPGMDVDGPLATGTLREKQSLQTDITLAPTRCYAILGYSRRIKDVDLYLLLPPGILAAQDGTDSSTPVIGGPDHPVCPLSSSPVTYKLRIVADQGSGEVAVQLYSKAR